MNKPPSAPAKIEDLAGELVSVSPPLWRLQIVRILEILGVIAMFLGGADWLNILDTLPTGSAPAWLFAIGGVINKTAKPVILFFGDWADDGIFNKSFRLDALPLWLICGFLALIFTACLPSCAGVYSGVTGLPIPTTPVQRTDGTGKPFDVATTDLRRAETQPGQAWGLYNAGAVAARTGQVVDSGK